MVWLHPPQDIQEEARCYQCWRHEEETRPHNYHTSTLVAGKIAHNCRRDQWWTRNHGHLGQGGILADNGNLEEGGNHI